MKNWNYKTMDIRLLLGVFMLGLFAILSVLIPELSPFDYSSQNAALQNLPSDFVHPFGTDKFGRDIFVRVWYGVRISLMVGIISTCINSVIGIAVGSWAGCAGGRIDAAIVSLIDIISAIPSMLYVILIMLVLGSGITSVIFGICVSGWLSMARIIRGEVKRLMKKEYCVSARLSGAGNGRLLFKHILPNITGVILVQMTVMVPAAIFTEAFLSFIGIGISAPMASLGSLIQDARSQMRVYPMQMIWPSVMLCLMMFFCFLIGIGMTKKTRE